jgi:signal transduction histidine kinase
MAEPAGSVSFSPHDLRPLAILAGLPDDVLSWLCARGERVELQAGERLFERGAPADALWIVVEGAIQGFEEIGGQWLLAATTQAGQVTGMLPFSRMTHYPRYTLAREHSVVLRLDTSHFREMLDVSDELARRLVACMSDRVRRNVRLEQQRDRMVALGRLSAGLAHELNNPIAAIRRDVARLAEQRAALPRLVTAMVRHHLDPDALSRLEALRAAAAVADTAELPPLERSEREDEVGDWLEVHGVAASWDIAATLVDGGVGLADLEDLATQVPGAALGDVLSWLSGGIESDRIVNEMDAACERISGLITSIKTYSHMDRSTEHKPTDVRTGLDNTVTMLGHQLKRKAISLVRVYDEDLPSIPTNAGEINQVWTSLIQNAVDAMSEGGVLTMRAHANDTWVEVEIADNGSGIPDELRPRIFEPFFTTKDVGVGMGLGLGIAQRIVRTHQGHIEVRSRPGETIMCVRLPKTPSYG